jgi:acetyl esterase/lipase
LALSWIVACGEDPESDAAGSTSAATSAETGGSGGAEASEDSGASTGADEVAGSGSSSGTDSAGDSGSGSGSGSGGDGNAPEVREDSTYDVAVSTLAYGQGMTHADWGGPPTGVIDLMLDIYEPVDAPPGRPAMVVIHGGGFTGGSKTAMAYVALAEYFAERGWVTISIDYRIADDHGTIPEEWATFVAQTAPSGAQDQFNAMYPAARDAKAAVRWLSANAETYQVDMDYVTSVGGSAGAFTAIMLGVTNAEDFRDELNARQDPTLATTHVGERSIVHTVLDHWGGATQIEILQSIDGVSRFDASDAPVSIVHGRDDEVVPFEAAEALRDAYIDTGVIHEFHPLEAGHGAWEETVNGSSLHELAWTFVVEQQALNVMP